MSQNSDNSFTMSVNKTALQEKSQSFLVNINIKDDHHTEVVNTIMVIVSFKDESSFDTSGSLSASNDEETISTDQEVVTPEEADPT